MKENEIIVNSFSSEDINRKKTNISFDIPQPQGLEDRYASEMPRRRAGAAPSSRKTSAPKAKKPTAKKTSGTGGSGGKKPSQKKRKIMLLAFVIALILLLVGSCKLIAFLNNPLIGETNEDILNAQDEIQDNMVTVLLVGADGGGTNTDTIMLAVLNNQTKEISLLSVPRDTRVPNPYGGSGYAKINSVYAAKGMAGLISQVRDVTGMPINFYAMINFKGFREAIDILGGVRFNVPVRMKYYDPLQNLDIDLYPGMQLLDGDKAEQLVRCRSVYAQADLARTEVQRKFISAVIEQHATAKNLTKLPDLYKAMEPYVKTSITANDAIKYGAAVVGIDAENIKSYMLPGAAGNYGSSGISYFVYDAEAAEDLAKEIGFKNPKVKKIPSPGKPNNGVTDADDVDADQTLDPEDQTPPEDDEVIRDDDKETSDKDKDTNKDEDKTTDKDKNEDNKEDEQEPSKPPKDEEDKPAEKPAEKTTQNPNDYPDGI